MYIYTSIATINRDVAENSKIPQHLRQSVNNVTAKHHRHAHQRFFQVLYGFVRGFTPFIFVPTVYIYLPAIPYNNSSIYIYAGRCGIYIHCT